MFTEKEKLITTGLISIVVLNLALNAQVLPELFNYQSSLKAAEIYNEKASDDDTFYTFRYAQFEMFFYAKTAGLKIKDEGTFEEQVPVNLEDAIKNEGAWFFCDEYSYYQIRQGGAKIESVYEFEHYYLTDINWKFLNPKTRKDALRKMFLIKTKKPENSRTK